MHSKMLALAAAHLTESERSLWARITDCSRHVLTYEDPLKQSLARSLIPIEKLERTACEKSGETASTPKTHDLLMLELLNWFKQEFFSWTDAPKCTQCGAKTKFTSSVSPNAEEFENGAHRVEGYQCETCNVPCRFPRYNNPARLLETRTGRCGEWANCFTLCARAVGFEVRYILDLTDHVWTEFYSTYLKRWVHCDSCENGFDSPLIYESGWGKKLTFVIAFSRDEVRDVTWRYSMNHRATIKRRANICREIVLESMLKAINSTKMKSLSKSKSDALMSRYVVELVEFVSPRRSVKETETGGRISGDLDWRRQRGELGDQSAQEFQSHSIAPTASEVEAGQLSIDYFSFEDIYRRLKPEGRSDDKEPFESITGWRALLYDCKNICRKIEQDWKQVYLCRKDGTKEGTLVWVFETAKEDKTDSSELSSSNDSLPLAFEELEIRLNSQTFENGKIRAIVCFNDSCFMLKSNSKEIINLNGCRRFKLEVVLNGGSGDNAWQHSQLFRAPFDSKEASLSINLKLKR